MASVHIDLTAYHEAAHAIVGLCHGRDVKELVVLRDEPGNGWARYYPRMSDSITVEMAGNLAAEWLATLEDYKAEIRIYLAGPLAEAKLLNTPLRSLGARSDLERAEQRYLYLKDMYEDILDFAELPHTVPKNLLAQLRRETRALIGRPEIWQMIENLAIELIWCKTLGRREIATVLQQLMDEHGQLGLYNMFD